MRFFHPSSAVAGTVALLALSSRLATGSPVETVEAEAPASTNNSNVDDDDDDFDYSDFHNSTLVERSCAYGCGYYNQVCCSGPNLCYTDSNGQAQCSSTAATATTTQESGEWTYYTSTWVETDYHTYTTIWSSWLGSGSGGGGVVTASATPTTTESECDSTKGYSWCGQTCCSAGYYCALSNQCALIGGSSVTGAAASTGTVSPTTTQPFETAVPTGASATTSSQLANSGGGGLSGGAIAGIVIGVIAGLFLLILLCLYCCARGIFHAIMAVFGLGKDQRRTHEESTYVEAHHHGGYGAAAGAGASGRRWYGSERPSRPPAKKSSGLGGWAGVGALLGGLALILGMKRRKERRDEKTESSYSYYTYSDYTSTSSASSDDHRTRYTETRHSRSASRR